MFLKESEKSEILKSFPNIELSYETTVHKKVYNFDYVMAIPEGKKYFAWFTVFKKQNVCALLEITENKQINTIEILKTSFKDSLCYGIGTIFYGTIFFKDNLRFFTIEDNFYSSGTCVNNKNPLKKFYFLQMMFLNELKQIAYFQNSVVFGLPLMNVDFNILLNKLSFNKYQENILKIKDINQKEKLPYKIKCFNFINHSGNNSGNFDIKSLSFTHFIHSNSFEKSDKREKNFIVKADIQNDIYHLYTSDQYYVGVAYISNYDCSVMMNKLFRNIKENENLDALEESDDEEEFQDERMDKYVSLDTINNMVCVYNNKFKKWQPTRLMNKGEKLTLKKDLFSEKNKA
jgi:hypothetical protein